MHYQIFFNFLKQLIQIIKKCWCSYHKLCNITYGFISPKFSGSFFFQKTPESWAVMGNNFLGTDKISKLLAKFSIPCIVSLLIGALYNLVDQIFIGNSELGIIGNAAVGVCFSLVMIAQAFAWWIGDGIAAFLTNCQGKKELKKASSVIANSIVITIVISVILTLITVIFSTPLLELFGATSQNFGLAKDYIIIVGSCFPVFMFTNMYTSIMRADGSPTFAMFTILSGAILNIALDPLFIYVFKLGIQGAAYATIAGQFSTLVFVIIYMYKTKTFKLTRNDFKFDFKNTSQALKLGISSFITQISIVVVTIVLNISLKKYGELSLYGSDIPQAIFSILTKVYSIVVNIVVGIVLGGQPIVGYNYSAKKYSRVKTTFLYILISTIIIGVLSTLLFIAFPELILSIFGSTNNALYMEFGIKTFRIYLMFIIFNLLIKVAAIFFQAVEEPFKAMLGALIRDLVVFIPLILILPPIYESQEIGTGINAILYSAPIADAMGFIIAIIMMIVFFRKLTKKEKELIETNKVL